MLRLLAYLLGRGLATQKNMFPMLDGCARGLPAITKNLEIDSGLVIKCAESCPTGAITTGEAATEPAVQLDLGKCISCGLCMNMYPELFSNDLSSRTSSRSREGLVLTSQDEESDTASRTMPGPLSPAFRKSLALRVVSTGCSACDLEIGAAFNPIFAAERFGISVVASPRMADALVVTGPCGKGMHDALRRAYEAMPEPRIVIAAGTCAISGGVHGGGYAEANGLSNILPVDVLIPGCPPHPWSIIHGVALAMGNPEALSCTTSARPALLPPASR